MRKTLKIAVREYTEAVRSKAFVIGIVLVPVLMSGSLLAMLLLKDQVDTTDKRIAVLDHTGVIAPALVQAARERNASETHDAESGRKVRPAYVLEIVAPGGQVRKPPGGRPGLVTVGHYRTVRVEPQRLDGVAEEVGN